MVQQKRYVLLTLVGDSDSYVIAQLLSETADDLLLGNPLAVQAHFDMHERAVVSWVKELVLFTKDGIVQMSKNAIATIASPSNQLIEVFEHHQSKELQTEFAQREQHLLNAVFADDTTASGDDEDNIPDPNSNIRH